MFNTLSSLTALGKGLRIVQLAIPAGVRGYDHFQVVSGAPAENEVTVKAGVVVNGPFIVRLMADEVLSGFTPPTAAREDCVYLDVAGDTDVAAIATIEGSAVPPVAPAGHVHIPLWVIHRANGVNVIDNEVALGYPGGVVDDPNNPSPYDRREFPSEFAPHNHKLLQGATDVTATAADVNHLTGLEVLDGVEPKKVTATRLFDLCGSAATGAQLDVLVGGGTTALHKHDASLQRLKIPGGLFVTPQGGDIEFELNGWDQVNLTTPEAGKVVLFIPVGVKNPMTETLDAANNKIINMPDPTAALDAVNKQSMDALIGLCVKYAAAEADINMAGHKITGLADGSAGQDAVTVQQLMTAIAGVIGGGLSQLDARYKLGGQDPSCINGNNLGKEAAGPVNMNTFIIRQLGDPTAAEDAVNLRSMEQALQDLYDQIEANFFPHDLTSHQVGFDLDMANNPTSQKHRIKNMQAPQDNDDAATKKFVEDTVAQLMPAPYEGDDLGDHRCIQPLDFNTYKGINLAEPEDATDAVNKAYVDGVRDALLAIADNLAKVGPFETRKNTQRLPISTKLGGSLDIRGKTDATLFYVGPDANGNDVIQAGTRIEQVSTPIKPADAVNRAFVEQALAPKPVVWDNILYNNENSFIKATIVNGIVYLMCTGVPAAPVGTGVYLPAKYRPPFNLHHMAPNNQNATYQIHLNVGTDGLIATATGFAAYSAGISAYFVYPAVVQ